MKREQDLFRLEPVSLLRRKRHADMEGRLVDVVVLVALGGDRLAPRLTTSLFYQK